MFVVADFGFAAAAAAAVVGGIDCCEVVVVVVVFVEEFAVDVVFGGDCKSP